ncbi:hypothetical protein EVAR_82396_1 [Eumeta japonica]|uniref:Uncharacterized protein n=1 Tax=Eumeta variegata TaxID=151549 RepID=A0A4C1UA31_EUMVA|nr:hypothetical protein EVAR_82396_1 [Eumeta japonica]
MCMLGGLVIGKVITPNPETTESPNRHVVRFRKHRVSPGIVIFDNRHIFDVHRLQGPLPAPIAADSARPAP